MKGLTKSLIDSRSRHCLGQAGRQIEKKQSIIKFIRDKEQPREIRLSYVLLVSYRVKCLK